MPLDDHRAAPSRASAMRMFARVPWTVLDPITKDVGQRPATLLRKPETGLVMVRGRMGGSGAAFNLGETTVTRCSVKLASGTEGHGYVMGRNADHALRVALCDAVFQDEPQTLVPVLDALEDVLLRARIESASKAAATRVDFFTMVRGDD
ncbi:MAG: phosphonate C-P lyase system protein PhnG [Rhizobiales bacterium]|nr:phosphonate C-P lyase system protein PhnG [Hyphomicrobiales bacterium]